MPAASMIVPNYNGLHLLPETVASLERIQVPEGGLEVYIVDDGSNDGSREWLRRHRFPDHIRILQHPQNLGRSHARNTGLKEVRGDAVIFIDGDMVCQNDLVEKHLEALSRQGVVAVAGCVKQAPTVPATRVNRYLYHASRRGARQFSSVEPLPFQYLLTNNMSVRRSVIDSGICFSDAFDGYGGEDTLFAWEIEQFQPAGIRYCDQAVVYDRDSHDLAQLLEKFSQYGRINLPRLRSMIGDEDRALRLDWVCGTGWKPVLGQSLIHPGFRNLARMLWKFTPYPLSDLLLRYLLAATTFGEFLEHQRCHLDGVDVEGRQIEAASCVTRRANRAA